MASYLAPEHPDAIGRRQEFLAEFATAVQSAAPSATIDPNVYAQVYRTELAPSTPIISTIPIGVGDPAFVDALAILTGNGVEQREAVGMFDPNTGASRIEISMPSPPNFPSVSVLRSS